MLVAVEHFRDPLVWRVRVMRAHRTAREGQRVLQYLQNALVVDERPETGPKLVAVPGEFSALLIVGSPPGALGFDRSVIEVDDRPLPVVTVDRGHGVSPFGMRRRGVVRRG